MFYYRLCHFARDMIISSDRGDACRQAAATGRLTWRLSENVVLRGEPGPRDGKEGIGDTNGGADGKRRRKQDRKRKLGIRGDGE